MPSIKERIDTFRGTRPARAIGLLLLLGFGVYNLFFEPGIISFGFGICFLVLGLLALYKLVEGESLTEAYTT